MIEKEVIHWSNDIQLNVSNFMAEPNPGIFEDSHSVIKYGFTWVVNSEQLNDQVVFSVENIQLSVEFNPLLSWIRMSEFNDGLLKHEQGHFDLAEIIKRKHQKIFENEFYDKKFPTRGQNDAQRKQYAKEDSGKMISLKVEKLNLYLKEKRDEYDQETDFGKNIPEQKKYDEIFNKLRK
ncbi:MAG: hypothetical protein ACPG6Z_06660 [Nitrosopumilus sp.]|jgi:hypothetical protein|nr:MAG: hypothetical protein HPQ69_03115 [Marine Group I thaumarchaeote]